MATEGNNTNIATTPNTGKRKIDEITRQGKIEESLNKAFPTFPQRKLRLFNKVTELSILCQSKTALIITTTDNKLYECGYPNYDTVIQQFLDGKNTMVDSEKKKEEEEIIETLRLEYEEIEDKLQEEKKNLQAVIDHAEKSNSDLPCWWNDSIDDMGLEPLKVFKTSLENLKLNLVASTQEKKVMIESS